MSSSRKRQAEDGKGGIGKGVVAMRARNWVKWQPATDKAGVCELAVSTHTVSSCKLSLLVDDIAQAVLNHDCMRPITVDRSKAS